jgi:hypothetical protein
VEEDFRIKSSVLADLGPLPEVVESNTDTVWKMFLQLEDRHGAPFSEAPWSQFGLPGSHRPRPAGDVSVDDVMARARRYNRICPVEPEWLRLQAILAEYGDAPPAAQGAAFRRMPALSKRTALREQVEWAADRGCLANVYAFLEALPEDRWTHMGD